MMKPSDTLPVALAAEAAYSWCNEHRTASANCAVLPHSSREAKGGNQ
ncbi:hypothetical protein [Streptosporangium jomthongense]|uniref:Uncharacterized protein n=1 Tax=Streptosporangium jomthongense TaxID=1193683 RepID=A0ABV8ETL4_9ACTN